MKIYHVLIFCLSLISLCFAQNEETILLPVNDSQRPLWIDLVNRRGSVTVDGYDGQVVIIHVQERFGSLQKSNDGKTKKLPVSATEDDNRVRIVFSPHTNAMDIKLRVPTSCNLEITNQEDGDITVNNIQGELVIENAGGGIFLNNIAGTAILSTIEGAIRARFTQVSTGKPMAFSSMDGTIEVRFPKNFGAHLKIKSVYGQIIPDHDLDLHNMDYREQDSSLSVPEDNWKYLRLGDGGAQILISTYNGDIYIRNK